MKIKNIVLPCLVSCIALLNTSCSSEQDTIKIGAVLPLSGTFAVYGQQALKGAQLAVEEINNSGGVLGHRLELLVRDNETNPAKTVTLTKELVQQEHVFSLMGPVSSASRYAMTEVAENFKTPMFYGIDYEGRHFSRYLICYSTIPEHYIEPVVPYLIENVGDKFYVFGYDYIWPHRMSERIIEAVDNHKGFVTNTEFTGFGTSDYSPVFQRIADSSADTLMLILPGADGFNFLGQMKEFDFGRKVSVVAFAADETYLTHLDPDSLDGVLTALHFFQDIQNAASDSFVSHYQQFHGKESEVTYSSKAHYDLVYLLVAAINKAGSKDKEAVIDALPGLELYKGKTKIRLREDHHFDLPMYLAQYSGQELKVIQSFGSISPDDQRLLGNDEQVEH